VARFLGLTNIVPLGSGREPFATPWGELSFVKQPPKGATKLLLRPEALALDPAGPLGGLVAAVTFRGETTTVHVRPAADAAGQLLEAHVRSGPGASPAVGQLVRLSVDPTGVLFLP
jgi:hypothetical protein